MTWPQVFAYILYLVITMMVFLPRTGAPAPPDGPAKQEKARRLPRWSVPVAVAAVPVFVAVLGGKPESAAPAVQVSEKDCGKGFAAAKPGRQVFQVRNTGDRTAEVYLIDPASNAVYGEVEGIAPGTTRSLVATIGNGSYAWRCVPHGASAVTSAAVHVSGGAATTAVLPVTEKDLDRPLAAYRAHVGKGLAELLGKTREVERDISGGDLAKARKDWLPAHLRYASLGAAYGTFGDFDAKINGRTAGLTDGVHDKEFTGFHRLEYGLWHDEPAKSLARVAKRLTGDVAALRQDFPEQDFDGGDLALRTHEILENTLHQEMTGAADYGSGSTLATAKANLDGTQVLLDLLRPLIDARNPKVTPAVDTWMKRTAALLTADEPERRRLNGSMGQLLEELAPIPDLLEIRKAG